MNLLHPCLSIVMLFSYHTSLWICFYINMQSVKGYQQLADGRADSFTYAINQCHIFITFTSSVDRVRVGECNSFWQTLIFSISLTPVLEVHRHNPHFWYCPWFHGFLPALQSNHTCGGAISYRYRRRVVPLLVFYSQRQKQISLSRSWNKFCISMFIYGLVRLTDFTRSK